MLQKVMLHKVKELRDKTNISLSACKKAIEDTNGDVDAAIVLLQKRGAIKAGEKSGRATNEGRVHSYIHSGRIGVLVEINCETDFASNSDEFKEFCEQVGLQIAAMKPDFVSEPTEEEVEKMSDIFIAQVPKGKPDNIREKIMQGKLNKWKKEVCLMSQQSVIVEGKTIEDLRTDLIGKMGENISVRRFECYEVGM